MTVEVSGASGFPAGASALVANLTAVGPRDAGYLTVFPAGSTRPIISDVNFSAGEHPTANLTVAELGVNNAWNIYNGSAGTVNVLVDVAGYYVGGGWTVQYSSVSADLTSIACDSTSTCVAAGHVTGASTGGGAGTAVYTTNGGASWALSSMPQNAFNLSGAVSCPSPEICFADGGGVGGNSGSAGIDTSSNAGASWISQSIPSGVSALLGLACPSPSTCFATGYSQSGGGLVLGTTDGGASWVVQTIPASVSTMGSTLSQVSCPDKTHCYVLGTAEPSSGTGSGAPILLTTSNGGSSWIVEQIPPAQGSTATGPLDLTGISCPAVSACFVSGVNLPDLDDGASWLHRLVGVAWHHFHHVTATNWSSADESVLVNEVVCFGLLSRVVPVEARFWAIPRALAFRRCTLWCALRWLGDHRSSIRRYVTRISVSPLIGVYFPYNAFWRMLIAPTASR
ncbi:MAG: WD40/YVTN/BNR-like repeat-containing protein [Acidimicrobiales bacterium]